VGETKLEGNVVPGGRGGKRSCDPMGCAQVGFERCPTKSMKQPDLSIFSSKTN